MLSWTCTGCRRRWRDCGKSHLFPPEAERTPNIVQAVTAIPDSPGYGFLDQRKHFAQGEVQAVVDDDDASLIVCDPIGS